MEKFNKFMQEAILMVEPQSDSVGAVEETDGDENKEEVVKDLLSSYADEVLTNLGLTDPNKDAGEMGEIQADGDMEVTEDDGVSLECMGEAGLKVSFNGLELTLPRNVVDKIKGFSSEESSEEDSEFGEDESQEHEENESPEFEAGEQEESEESENESEESEDDDDMKKSKNPFGESKNWNFDKKGKGKGKKEDKDDDSCDCKGKGKGKKKFPFWLKKGKDKKSKK